MLPGGGRTCRVYFSGCGNGHRSLPEGNFRRRGHRPVPKKQVHIFVVVSEIPKRAHLKSSTSLFFCLDYFNHFLYSIRNALVQVQNCSLLPIILRPQSFCQIQQKDLELQEQAARLSELEHESREAHHKNVELTARIQELMERREDGVSVGDAVRSMEGGTGEGEAGEEGDAEAAAEKEALLKKLKRLEASVELKARQLETVTARVRHFCLFLSFGPDKSAHGLPCRLFENEKVQ